MANIREIITRWNTPAGGDNLTVMYFQEAVPDVNDQRQAIDDCFTGFASAISNQVTYSVDQEGRVVDETTGELQAYWQDPVGITGGGTSTGQPVADSTQVLLRWATAGFVAGRNVKGRTFIPGLAANTLENGNINVPTRAGLLAGATVLPTAGVGFGVWSRPTDSRVGSHYVCSAASVWSELAVLRNRRG